MKIFSGLSKINWVADVLTPAAAVLMEVCSLYPWLIFAGKLPDNVIHRTPLSIFSAIILLGLSFLATRFFLKRKWPEIWIQTCVLLCALIAVVLVLRIEYNDGSPFFSSQWFVTYGKIIFNFFAANNPFVYGLLACAFIWWRGIRLSRSRLYFDDIYTNFGIQLLLLVVLIIFWGFTYKTEQLKTLTSQVGIYVAGFFFFGLLGLAVANLKIIQERIRKKGETTKNFSRKWLTIILTVIGSMFLVAMIFASLFSEQTQATIRQIMNRITDIYAWVVEIIIYFVGWIVQLVYFVVEWIVSLFSGQKPPTTPDLQGLPNMNNVQDRTPGALSPSIFLVIKLVILAVIVLAVIFVIMKAVKRRGLADRDEDLDEEKESLWSWDGFKADFILFFKNLFGRFRRKRVQIEIADSAKNWKPEEDVRRTLSIREIYQHLLWQGARLHVPREGFETPSEYAARLGHFTPDIQQPLDEITGLYLDVRYGDYSAGDAQTENANTIWQKLLDALKPPERQE